MLSVITAALKFIKDLETADLTKYHISNFSTGQYVICLVFAVCLGELAQKHSCIKIWGKRKTVALQSQQK